jgi:hypothetical protein
LYYEHKERDDQEVIDVLNHFAQKHPRNGFRKLFFVSETQDMNGTIKESTVSISSWGSISVERPRKDFHNVSRHPCRTWTRSTMSGLWIS